MSELFTSGSVGGAAGNRCLYPAADPLIEDFVVACFGYESSFDLMGEL